MKPEKRAAIEAILHQYQVKKVGGNLLVKVEDVIEARRVKVLIRTYTLNARIYRGFFTIGQKKKLLVEISDRETFDDPRGYSQNLRRMIEERHLMPIYVYFDHGDLLVEFDDEDQANAAFLMFSEGKYKNVRMRSDMYNSLDVIQIKAEI